MARERLLKIGCINVVTHPHSPENYISLFETINSMKKEISIGHRRKIIMGLLNEDEFEGQRVLHGLLYKFDDLDENTEWYNTKENSEASKDDLGQLQIPDHLRPNLTKHKFVFFPRGHRLFVETKGSGQADLISVHQVKKYFDTICNGFKINHEFGEINFTIATSKQRLQQMLASKNIVELKYEISLPNPDVVRPLSVAQRMQERGLIQETRSMKARGGENIILDDELIEASTEASQNGHVEVKVKEDHRTETLSSKDHPLITRTSYDPETEDPTQKFWVKALNILHTLI